MSIVRVNGASWGIGDELTSAQMNGVDLNTTYCLDKRSGQTDTLESIVSAAGAGRIVDLLAAGANAATSYTIATARQIRVGDGAVTANRTYTLSATGAVSGDRLTIFCLSDFNYTITVLDQASAQLITLGNGDAVDAVWATFVYDGGWKIEASGANAYVSNWARNARAIQGLNFFQKVTATSATMIRYVPGQREWLEWDYGSNNALRVTDDIFDDWSSTDLLTDTTYNALPTCDVDGDDSGNRLVLFDNIDAASSYNGSTWTNLGGTVFGDDPDRPALVWEPITGNWIAASKKASPGLSAMASSSANRTTWTARTNPFPADTFCTLAVNRLGTAVMAGYNGTNLYVSRSTDGGVTWSAMTTLALGFTAEREGLYWLRPVWSGDRWYVAATNITSTDTKVYASTDGSSWSLVATLTGWGFKSFAAIGHTIVALAVQTTGDVPTVVVSVDRGVTWTKTDRAFVVQLHSVVSNGARFIIAAGSRVYPSLAVGSGVSAIT